MNSSNLRGELNVVFTRLLECEGEQLDYNQPFLAMGADSYTLISAMGEVKRRWSAGITLRQLFEDTNTIEKLAASIEEAGMTESYPSNTESSFIMAAPQEDQVLTSPLSTTSNDILGSAEEQPVTSPLLGRITSEFCSDETFSPTDFIESWKQRTRGSRSRSGRDLAPLVDNRRLNGGANGPIASLGYPLVVSRSDGPNIWDIDGNKYVDLSMGYGACAFGHKPRFLVSALLEQIDRGYALGAEPELALENAALVSKLTRHDRVIFNSSGTEAVLTAVRVARSRSGRNTIAVFQGSYHGHFDEVLVAPETPNSPAPAIPGSRGVPVSNLGNVVVLPFGSDAALEYVDAHAGELAAVLVEPVQNRRPDLIASDFLRRLRALTREKGCLLIFDEVLTGFRVAPGGASQLFGIQPDISTYGKIVGGGLPIGVVAGRADVLDVIDRPGCLGWADRTFTAGTFSKHPLCMATANAVLNRYVDDGEALCASLNKQTEAMARRLNALFASHGSRIQVHVFGSFFRFAVDGNLSFVNQGSLSEWFRQSQMAEGIYIWEGGTCFLSTAHTPQDIDRIIAGTVSTLRRLSELGLLDKPCP